MNQTAAEVFILPASFAQQRLWFVDQLDPDSPLYNILEAIRISGPINVGALQQAVEAIVARHEVLRTTFANVQGSPVQVISPTMSVTLAAAVDLTGLAETEREEEALRLAKEEARRPFDLSQGPLLRTSLLRLSNEEHVLLLITHHIVFDGWSVGIFFRELVALYEAFSQGRPSPLAELPIQYADYAVWQREWLTGEVSEKQFAYWRRQLDGAPSVLNLPADGPRPAAQSFRGAHYYLSLPGSLSESLEALSRREGVTLFMTLLAAVQTLLMRYTGQEDIVVGSPIAGRVRTETENLIGCFINQLVMRTDLSGDPSFRELLGRVREVTLAAYAHQDLPFEKLVEELQPARSLSVTPLFQVMFVLQNTPRQALELPGLSLTPDPLQADNGTSKFDIRLEIVEKAEGLSCLFEYNTDLFEAATIRRMAGHFRVLLEAIVGDPDQRLSQLPLLTEGERHQLLVEWNDTETAFPDGACLHQLFEQQVAHRPDAVAVVCAAEQVSYGELNRRANQLARHLRARGVGPDVPVGLCLERSVEMVVGMLGILKAGGAYVPLDPSYPPERLSFMLADTQTAVLVTQASLVARLPADGAAAVVCLDADWDEVAREGAANVDSGVGAADLAYVIYTSGSTGQPKGIAIRHRGVVNNLFDLNRRFNVGPTDRVLALSSLSFDMCVYEVLGTLEAGAAIVLPEASVERDPAHWAELMLRHKVSVWNSAPALLEMLVEYISERDELRPRHLRLALLGGDWVAVTLPGRLRALVPDLQVAVMGGATEASIHSTIYEVKRTDPRWKSIPYGRPMANQQAYILDGHLQPVPVGVAGELHLGGVGLARGYFNRPELTAERFTAHPFGAAGERLYRTGDLARWRADGNIELMGRMDFQVKVRGHRIELGEVEAALKRQAGVEEAVAAVREDGAGERRLVGYVVCAEGAAAPTPGELRARLRQTLPEYMVPSAFVVLERMPLTPNGKVDRRALPEPEGRAESGGEYVAPRDAIEEVVAGVWAEVLGVERVGVHDNFFELGGHSLKATQVMSRVHEALGVEVALRRLFESPTVAQLAEDIKASSETSREDLIKIAQVLIRLNQLSEDEAKMMLAE